VMSVEFQILADNFVFEEQVSQPTKALKYYTYISSR
jgi:hypothetical protein